MGKILFCNVTEGGINNNHGDLEIGLNAVLRPALQSYKDTERKS
jgi:hypothetical protein